MASAAPTHSSSHEVCANTGIGKNPGCKNAGTMACSSCLLVTYCSKTCQKAHWAAHEADCKSPLLEDTWKPAWVRERRTPAFMDDGPPVAFGTIKYLWGNIPAVDVVKLEENEGKDFAQPLSLLFAASGDLRNVILSVSRLPQVYKSPLTLVINDNDFDIVARNAILLLLFFTIDDPEVAAEHAVHVFYSALLKKSCYNMARQKIRRLIREVCDKIAGRPAGALVGKTWKFGQRDLRLVLSKESWFKLLSFFDVPRNLTKDKAQRVRSRIVSAPERVDFVDRHLANQPAAHRASIVKFRSDGLLLPFGSSRTDFEIPNPTIFQTASEWPMLDNADPLTGWDMESIQAAYPRPATNDLYGKLYHYLLSLFVQFHRLLASRPVSVKLFQVDARSLPAHLESIKFDRVEVSNISDGGYIGNRSTLCSFAPLLQSPTQNPHATLITLFLNAVQETVIFLGREHELQTLEKDMKQVMKYLPAPQSYRDPIGMSMHIIKTMSARELVRDVDALFNLYMKAHDFDEVGGEVGLVMNDKHTIVKAWPMRFSFGPATEAKKKEFAVLLASPCTGQERYVEWQILENSPCCL